MLGPHTVTVLRAAQVPSDYGNSTRPDWAAPTRRAIEGCSVQPANTDEFTVDRDTFTTRYQAWLPGEPDVLPGDRVEWQGVTYDVDGDVLRWGFPPLSHTVLILRRSDRA